MKVGDLVRVGQRYVMSEHPPHVGNGTYVDDEYTGKVFRIVAIRPPGKYRSCTGAALALPGLVGVDESDEVVDIACGRLTVVSP